MIFPYKWYGARARPVIPVQLRHNENILQYEVLVDSGADFCIFSSEIGELMGLSITDGEYREVLGLGAKRSPYYIHEVELSVGSKTSVISAGFISDVSGEGTKYGIAGQKGFFDSFIVTFDRNQEILELN